MTFLNPLGFLLAAAAPVIVLLYLVRRRRPEVRVSSLLLWRQMVDRARRRMWMHRLRAPLSLLLQILILGLIVLAAARPEWRILVGQGLSTAVVIDCGIGMQTVGAGGRARFEEARRIARTYLRRAGPFNEISLIAFDSEPRVVAAPGDDPRDLLVALDALRPSDAASRPEPALELASDLLAARAGARRIVLLTDGPRPAARGGVALECRRVGDPADNVALAHLSARPLAGSPTTNQVFVQVRNEGGGERSGNVEFRLDGALFDVRPFRLGSGEAATEILSVARAGAGLGGGGLLVARIDVADALGADNVARAIVAPPPARSVLLVGPGDYYLERLLAVDGQTALRRIGPAEFGAGMVSRFDVVIFDRCLPHGIDLARLTRGNFLLLGVAPFDDGSGSGGPPRLDRPVVTDVDSSSPLLRQVHLESAGFARALALDVERTARAGWAFVADARSSGHGLILRGQRRGGGGDPGQRAVVYAFASVDTDLPLRVAYPLLVTNTLQWLAGENGTAPLVWRAGESRVLAPGQSIWTRPWDGSGAAPGPPPADQCERGSFRPMDGGFYLVEEGGRRRWIAVNAGVRSGRSGPAAEGMSLAGDGVVEETRSFFLARPPWFTLGLAALLLVVGEWWLYHRRKTE